MTSEIRVAMLAWGRRRGCTAQVDEALGLVGDLQRAWMPPMYMGMRPTAFGCAPPPHARRLVLSCSVFERHTDTPPGKEEDRRRLRHAVCLRGVPRTGVVMRQWGTNARRRRRRRRLPARGTRRISARRTRARPRCSSCARRSSRPSCPSTSASSRRGSRLRAATASSAARRRRSPTARSCLRSSTTPSASPTACRPTASR